MFKNKLNILLLLFFSFFLNHCGSEKNPDQEENAIKYKIYLQGQSEALSFLYLDQKDGYVYLEIRPLVQEVEWSSSHPAIAAFIESGVLQVFQAGDLNIRAVVDGEVVELPVRIYAIFDNESGNELPNEEESEEEEGDSPKPFNHDNLINNLTSIPLQPNPEPDPQDPIPEPVPSDHFIDELIEWFPGENAGFGQNNLPDIIMGGPQGNGHVQGGLHVLSLGMGGEIVVKSETPVLNGEGIDLIVFENAFFAGGNPENIFMEMGEVSVSQDGQNFYHFSCNQQTGLGCAGVHPVYANVEKNNIDPLDPQAAGGDAFDLEDLDLDWIQYVKIKDVSGVGCQPVCYNGFDLDAIAFIYQ